MKLQGNTIFITGGGSGIGRALAEAFHLRGNQVIISGRRRASLEATASANPGMQFVEVDITDLRSIQAASTWLLTEHPKLNVLINNAGIMQFDDLSGQVDDELLVATVSTNLLGPIRMTSALLGHLLQQPEAVIMNVSSVLGFIPMAMTGIYSATKAAVHSYSLSLRHKLLGSSVQVLEVIPPWVQTELLNSQNEPQAMPLPAFIKELMQVLATDAVEIMVERAKPIRRQAGPGEAAFVTEFNQRFSTPATPH